MRSHNAKDWVPECRMYAVESRKQSIHVRVRCNVQAYLYDNNAGWGTMLQSGHILASIDAVESVNV